MTNDSNRSRFTHDRVKRSFWQLFSRRNVFAPRFFFFFSFFSGAKYTGSQLHVAKIRDDETSRGNSRVIFQAYRLPRRSCHRSKKQYFPNRPYKPAINFPPPLRNFPSAAASLNTSSEASMTLKIVRTVSGKFLSTPRPSKKNGGENI